MGLHNETGHPGIDFRFDLDLISITKCSLFPNMLKVLEKNLNNEVSLRKAEGKQKKTFDPKIKGASIDKGDWVLVKNSGI